jgi:hypothetical protein
VAGVDEPWRWWKHCAACGDRIGVYEPVWIEHPDVGMIRSSYLQLDPVTRRHGCSFWHDGCVTPTPTRRHARRPSQAGRLLGAEGRYGSRAGVTATPENVSANLRHRVEGGGPRCASFTLAVVDRRDGVRMS